MHSSPLTPAAVCVRDQRALFALARTLVRDPHLAEDLTQDAMVAGLRFGADRARDVTAWLRGTLRHLVRRDLRARRRRAGLEQAAARPEALPAPEELLERARLQRRLADAVLSLDEPYRTAVLLRFFEGLPPRQIASRQGVPVATVRTRLQRALVRLRDQLGVADGGRWRWFTSALIFWPRRAAAIGHTFFFMTMATLLAASAVTAAWALGHATPGARGSSAAAPVAASVVNGGVVDSGVVAAGAFPVQVSSSPVRTVVQDTPPIRPSGSAHDLVVRVCGDDGRPRAGASVEVFPPEWDTTGVDVEDRIELLRQMMSGGLRQRADAERLAACGTSGSDGRCTLNLPETRMRLVATAAGGETSGWIDVDLARLQPARELAVRLVPGCRVHGRVLDTHGAPIPGRLVTFYPVGAAAGFRPRTPPQATTDAHGEFTFWCDPQASFLAVSEGELRTARRRFATTPAATVEIELRQLGAARIDARVVDESGTDVHGALVWAVTQPVDETAERFLAEPVPDGALVTIALPAAGRYRVHACVPAAQHAEPEEVEVVVGATARVTLVLRANPGLAGAVFDAQRRPMAGVPVTCCNEGDPEIGARCRTTTTLGDGSFAFDDLEPGARYALSWRPDPSDPDYVARRTHLVPGMRGLELFDEAGALPLRLRVVDGATGRPVSGYACRVLRAGAQSFALQPISERGDARGELALRGLATGQRYAVGVLADGFAPAWLEGEKALEESPKTIALVRPGRVRVHVRDVDGSDAEAVTVSLIDPTLGARAVLVGMVPWQLATDATGCATIEGLAPGRYRLGVDAGTRRAALDTDAVVDVRAGERSSTTIQLVAKPPK